MTKEQLIDAACKWLDQNNSDSQYITIGSKRTFINGGLQTNLRHFLNQIKDEEGDYWEILDKYLYKKK